MCKFTLKKLNKVAVISNFLVFFQFLVDKFTFLDPDPGGKMNADPCGSRSGSTALMQHSMIQLGPAQCRHYDRYEIWRELIACRSKGHEQRQVNNVDRRHCIYIYEELLAKNIQTLSY